MLPPTSPPPPPPAAMGGENGVRPAGGPPVVAASLFVAAVAVYACPLAIWTAAVDFVRNNMLCCALMGAAGTALMFELGLVPPMPTQEQIVYGMMNNTVSLTRSKRILDLQAEMMRNIRSHDGLCAEMATTNRLMTAAMVRTSNAGMKDAMLGDKSVGDACKGSGQALGSAVGGFGSGLLAGIGGYEEAPPAGMPS